MTSNNIFCSFCQTLVIDKCDECSHPLSQYTRICCGFAGALKTGHFCDPTCLGQYTGYEFVEACAHLELQGARGVDR